MAAEKPLNVDGAIHHCQANLSMYIYDCPAVVGIVIILQI